MEIILAIICVLSFIAFVVGMIKPKAVLFGIIPPKRKFVALIYVVLFFVSAAIGGSLLPDTQTDKEKPMAVAEDIRDDSIAQPLNETILVDSAVYITEPPEKPVDALPEVQQTIISIVKQCLREYNKAPNELKKSAARTKRGNMIKKTLGGKREFTDWICIVRRMSTTSQGNATFSLRIENSTIIIGNESSELFDAFIETLIPQSNPLYDIISELKKGDKVKVSGIFFPSTNKDFINENSLTERGSMEEPDFTVRYKAVIKI